MEKNFKMPTCPCYDKQQSCTPVSARNFIVAANPLQTISATNNTEMILGLMGDCSLSRTESHRFLPSEMRSPLMAQVSSTAASAASVNNPELQKQPIPPVFANEDDSLVELMMKCSLSRTASQCVRPYDPRSLPSTRDRHSSTINANKNSKKKQCLQNNRAKCSTIEEDLLDLDQLMSQSLQEFEKFVQQTMNS